MRVGQIICSEGEIELNRGKKTIQLQVKNEGECPIKLTSHYHFFETNRALRFDRSKAFGYRLNIPAGTSLLILPGEEKTVELVEFGGRKEIWGFNNLTNGPLNEQQASKALVKAKEEGFIKEGNTHG